MNHRTVVMCLLLAVTAGHLSEATEPSSVSPPARTVAITIDDEAQRRTLDAYRALTANDD